MPSFAQMLARMSDLFAGPGRGIPLANRNGFIDGAFDCTLGSAVTLTATQQYTNAVMWLAQAGVGGAGNVNVISARGGPGVATAMDTNPINCFQFNMTTASTGTFAGGNLPALWQKVEWVNKYAGKSVTVSCKLWCAAGTCVIPGVLGNENFGTGGSSTAGVRFDKNVNWTVTPTIQKFSARVDLPAIPNGVVYGTNSNDFIAIGLWLPASWTGTLYVAEMQLELCNPNSSNDLNGNGGAPTAYEHRGFGAELSRVDRYFQWDYTPMWGYQSNTNDTYRNWIFKFRTSMRQVPAISGGATGGTTSGWVPSFSPSMNGLTANYNFANTTSNGNIAGYSADARL